MKHLSRARRPQSDYAGNLRKGLAGPGPLTRMTKEENSSSVAGLLAGRDTLIEWLYEQAQAAQWKLPLPLFAEVLARSAQKRFAGEAPPGPQLVEYLSALHLEDLALACACAEGDEVAWNHFVRTYRGYLRSAAGAILGCGAESAEACELADTVYADLYGLPREKRERRVLFRYYHGRSKLSTWLRAVLAQRHVDALRAARRLEPLEDAPAKQAAAMTRDSSSPTPLDPDRPRYLALFRRALETALARLDARDAQRLALYYAEDLTLAEVGRRLGEHESSVSRNLERIRGELRRDVENLLRSGMPRFDGQAAETGLGEAQITLCLQYAVEDVPLDLGKGSSFLRLLRGSAAGGLTS